MGPKSVVKATSKTSVQLKSSTAKVDKTKQKKTLIQYLKLLETGDIHLIDIDAISEEFFSKPQLGDHMQYELHKYCQKGLTDKGLPLVRKLTKLCYSNVSVSQFTNMDRFVGCVYYISSCFLKNEDYQSALEVVHSFEFKKKEIMEASKEKSDMRNYLCLVHSSFMAAAVALASKIQSNLDKNYTMCLELAKESMKVLLFINGKQLEIGKKVLKTSKLYLQTLKYYKDEDVCQFYGILKNVLKNLLPVFCNHDYFYYYLHKMDQIKNVDYEVLRRTIRLVSLLWNFSETAKVSLNALLNSFFKVENVVHVDESLFNDLQTKDSHSELYFLLVSVIFCHGIQFWWNSVSNWSTNVSASVIEKLCKRICEMCQIHYGSSTLYCISKSQYGICFGDLINGNLQKIQYTVRLCLKNKVPNALNLVPISRHAFKLLLDCLDFTNGKPCCKEQRIYAWKHSVVHHTNTVEDILRHPPTVESWWHLRDLSQEILREIVNSKFEPPYDFKRVTILFQRWHHASIKLENYSDALLVCVLYYLCYPQEEADIISMWIQTKSESSNEIVEEMTVSHVFKTNTSVIRDFSRKLGSDVNMKPLLLMELKAYSTCSSDTFQNSKTCYNLAQGVWKHLEKCNLDIWEMSFALCCLVVAHISGENGRLPQHLHDKCKSLINELMQLKMKGKMQCRSILHAANLRFILFLYEVKLAESLEGKMDSSEMVLGYLKKAEEEKVKFGDDVDLNLTCNLIPSSSHLTVELETNYLNELNEIVDLWGSALRYGVEGLPKAIEFDSWLRNVQQVAHMYELIGEYQRSFTTWLLSYKIGKLCQNSGAILLGLSHFLKSYPDVDNSGLLEEGEVVSGKLSSENKERYTVVEYSLTVAANYLKNKKFEKCLEYLTRSRKTVEGMRSTIKTYALTARLWCLISQLLCIHPEFDVVFGYPRGVDVRLTAFKAFGYVNAGGRSELIKSATQMECTELVLAMIEVNKWAYHLHGTYRQADFMRFFLDDLYQIVQRLFLPTRTAEMLVRLAEVDIICEKTSDCQGKITKLKSILTTLSPAVKSEKPSSPYLSIPQGRDLDMPSPRPISPARFLDKPITLKEANVSPVQYHLNDVKPIKSKEHLKKCKCRLCQNLLIQRLTMETLQLEGDIINMEKWTKKAATCYKLANEAMNKLEHVRAEQSELLLLDLATALKEKPGGLDFQLSSVQFHSAKFLIKYAFFESSTSKAVTETVTKAMVKVSKLIRNFSYEEKLLGWTFTELKLYCVVVSKNVNDKPSKRTPIPCKTPNVAKTPFIGNSKSQAPSIAGKNKNNKMAKSPLPCHEKGKKIVYDEENSNSDPINTAFIGAEELEPEKISLGRKMGAHGRKLSFHTDEPDESKTVKKAPRVKKYPARGKNLRTS